MKTLRILLAAALALTPVASASALDRLLPAPRVKDNGDVRLSDDLKIGRYQGGKFISQPDALDLQGPGITCAVGSPCDGTPLSSGGRTLGNIAARTSDTIHLADTCAPATDCTAAFAAAGVLAAAQKKALLLPPYTFTVSGRVSLTGRQHIYGYGRGVSVINLTSNANIQYRGGQFGNEASNELNIHDFTVRTSETLNTSPGLLDIAWESRDLVLGSGATRTLTMSGIDVAAVQPTPGTQAAFKVGVRLFNTTNAQVFNNRVRNNHPNIAGTVNWKIGTDLQAVDMFFMRNSTYFGETGWLFEGTGQGQGFEALEMRDNLTIVNDYGMVVTSPTAHDMVKLIGNNFNNAKKGVSIQNMHNVHVIGNLFYVYGNGAPDQQWVGLELFNSALGFTFGANNIVTDNSFFGYPGGSTPTKLGMQLTTADNANMGTVVGNNQFAGLNYGVVINGTANNVKVLDTNGYKDVTFDVVDAAGTNIVARHVASANGYSRSNNGAVTAWGTASLVVDASRNVTVPLTGNHADAFKEKPYVAIAQNSFPGAGPSRVLSWNQNLSSATQLVFHVDGAAAGDNFQLSWRAEGR